MPTDTFYVPRRVYRTVLALLPDAPMRAVGAPTQQATTLTRALTRYREADLSPGYSGTLK